VNVFDGGEFTKAHLESINDPEKNLLIILLSQSGETRDLNIATTICREYSSNRKNKLQINKLINDSNILEFTSNNLDNNQEYNNQEDEIKILGIINVIGSLISRRTIDNIYTNCGRENAVASTKSCTAQIISCLLLAIYKSEVNNTLIPELKSKFINDLDNLQSDIIKTIELNSVIEKIAKKIISKNKFNMFLLGKDELCGSALEGALKIKEIAYIHAEGFNITALKHGPYALIEKDTPIVIIYKKRDHFIKSIVEEIKTRGAYVIEITSEYINLLDFRNQ
jgi:glucosamine 6-phosphate synthetase-like amidotransferase/phosphosugar isomerase protein